MYTTGILIMLFFSDYKGKYGVHTEHTSVD